jgi:segregation and condensation protein A
MDYKVSIDNFDGPLDLLLHLIKKSDIDIYDIKIEEIIKQYLDYISEFKKMDLDIASEYLVMASELMEIKSSMLLPNENVEEDEYEEDPRENLINRLIEYKRYKEITSELELLEEERNKEYTRESSSLKEYKIDAPIDLGDISLNDLMNAFQKFLDRKNEEKPLNTKVTKRGYSVALRSKEIHDILKEKKKVEFEELFEEFNKEYLVVTFISILDLVKKQSISIKQENNFSKIFLSLKESD